MNAKSKVLKIISRIQSVKYTLTMLLMKWKEVKVSIYLNIHWLLIDLGQGKLNFEYYADAIGEAAGSVTSKLWLT